MNYVQKFIIACVLILSGYGIGYQSGLKEQPNQAPAIVKKVMDMDDLNMNSVSYMCQFLESKGMLDEYRTIRPLDLH